MPEYDSNGLLVTEADSQIRECLDAKRSFSVVAGAGSGKTMSLVSALEYIRERNGKLLRRDGKKIACITFTNRAVDVISSRLGWDDLYFVSTLHGFLWGEIKRFTTEIKHCLKENLIPAQIEKQKEKDNGGNSQGAISAREKIVSLTNDLETLDAVEKFKYDNTSHFSNYSEGRLSHDDVVAIAGIMISGNEILKKIIGQKFPYIFIDEAQDTFTEIVEAINLVCAAEGLPIVGYFGDPMQQIYDKRAGDFRGPEGALRITKTENFRCAPQVITLLNRFRCDVEQYPAGENANVQGSVELALIQAEKPEAPRNRYSNDQLDRAAIKFDSLLDSWGWRDEENVKSLFLVRQMIARRLGFVELHKLFTGEYTSSHAQDDYESGNHSLLKPFIVVLWPLVKNYRNNDIRSVMNILREFSPAFDPDGNNAHRTLKEMLEMAGSLIDELSNRWDSNNLKEILQFARNKELCGLSERVLEDLDRELMQEQYDKDTHSSEKGRWLADRFFAMNSSEITTYADFINDNTPFSTQHGVKGEEYKNVVVVFDDIEAAWTNYSFSKMLTPGISGEATDGQLDRSRKLAYVCFSRAEVNLKIIFFTPNPSGAKSELIKSSLFTEEQFRILS